MQQPELSTDQFTRILFEMDSVYQELNAPDLTLTELARAFAREVQIYEPEEELLEAA